MEAKVIALTFPIKDIYAKIEELEQTNTKNQESLTTSLGEIDTRYDNLVFNIETKTDQQTDFEKSITERLKALSAKYGEVKDFINTNKESTKNQFSEHRKIISSLQGIVKDTSFEKEDRIYVREIGQTVDQLVDQVNELTDQQDQLGTKLAKVQKRQNEPPSMTLPSLNNNSQLNYQLNNSQLPQLLAQPSPLAQMAQPTAYEVATETQMQQLQIM